MRLTQHRRHRHHRPRTHCHPARSRPAISSTARADGPTATLGNAAPRRAHNCAGSSAEPSPAPAPVRSQRGAHRRRVVLLIGWLVAASLLLTSSAARAETTHVVALARTLDEVLSNIRNWIMGILAGFAIVLFSIAGLRYLMASGDPGEVEKAKGAFKAGLIGFGLAALAPLVVEILKGIVGGV